ncbi:AraC family transcriptional regulator [Pigmentiphaga soli]|uniref:AraC family transcriptional regulator n=1 Tax=Pigmentiphaga soli TaxID=1007095 RepID=A0ABP8H0C1_9BURK
MSASAYPVINELELAAPLRIIASNYRVLSSSRALGSGALRGMFSVQSLRDGLFLHMSDTVYLNDLVTSSVLDGGLKLALVIDGLVDISYGPRRLLLGSPREHRKLPVAGQAALVNLLEPTLCVRHGVAGRYSRAISLTVMPQWLCQSDFAGSAQWRNVARFLGEHLATAAWQPSPRVLALVRQMLSASEYAEPMRRLYLESRAIDIACEAIGHLAGETAMPAAQEGVHLREYRRLDTVRELIDSGEADALSVEAIASKIGMSASTLQRYFRAVYGRPVFDYLRDSRMRRARQALERDGVSVAQAAALAGYSNPANFATAMRRYYGLKPSELRARV